MPVEGKWLITAFETHTLHTCTHAHKQMTRTGECALCEAGGPVQNVLDVTGAPLGIAPHPDAF